MHRNRAWPARSPGSRR